MSLQKIQADFETGLLEAQFPPGRVTWADVLPSDLEWVLSVTDTDEEAVDELINLFNCPENFVVS